MLLRSTRASQSDYGLFQHDIRHCGKLAVQGVARIFLIASQSNNVYMTSTLDASSTTTAINFADRLSRRRGGIEYEFDEDHYSIWSCKFSADGNEIVAGGREMIFGRVSPVASSVRY